MSRTIADRLLGLLGRRDLAWTAPIEHFETIGSTNDHLKERARAAAPEWSVVLADCQTSGRGRHGRVWASPPGNLCLSVLLRPGLPASATAVLPLAAGVAVAEALEEMGCRTWLKWPNDVVTGGRKIAGILAEGASGVGGLEAIVLGIGVNLSLEPADLPPEVRQHATSVRTEAGSTPAPAEAAASVLARLRVWYDALGRDGPGAVVAAWRDRSLPWWGRTVEVRSGSETLRGVARDVDARGALLLDLRDGSTRAVLSGEAREVRLP